MLKFGGCDCDFVTLHPIVVSSGKPRNNSSYVQQAMSPYDLFYLESQRPFEFRLEQVLRISCWSNRETTRGSPLDETQKPRFRVRNQYSFFTVPAQKSSVTSKGLNDAALHNQCWRLRRNTTEPIKQTWKWITFSHSFGNQFDRLKSKFQYNGLKISASWVRRTVKFVYKQ